MERWPSDVASAPRSICSRCWTTSKRLSIAKANLVINLDNGPENHSRRTQFMYRLVAFAQAYGLTVRGITPNRRGVL